MELILLLKLKTDLDWILQSHSKIKIGVNNMVYNIGIVDDDATKITQLITYLRLGWNDIEGNLIKEKYKDVK